MKRSVSSLSDKSRKSRVANPKNEIPEKIGSVYPQPLVPPPEEELKSQTTTVPSRVPFICHLFVMNPLPLLIFMGAEVGKRTDPVGTKGRGEPNQSSMR